MCSEGSFARDVSCTNAAASILLVLRAASELYNSPRRSRQHAKRSSHFSSSLIDADISTAIRGSLTAAILTDFGVEYANSIAWRSDFRGRCSFLPLNELISNFANTRHLGSSLTITSPLRPP